MRAFYVAGTIAAIALFIIDSIRKYRATGKIPWWWFIFPSPPVLVGRLFYETHPELRFSRKERRIAKFIVRGALGVLLLSIIWIPSAGFILRMLGVHEEFGLVVWPAILGLGSSIFILFLRWWLFLSGAYPGDRER